MNMKNVKPIFGDIIPTAVTIMNNNMYFTGHNIVCRTVYLLVQCSVDNKPLSTYLPLVPLNKIYNQI